MTRSRRRREAQRNKKPLRERIENHPDLPWIAWIGSFVIWVFLMALILFGVWFFKAP